VASVKKFNAKQYTQSLREAFELLGNPKIAAEQSAYMKNLFPFFGIKTPERSTIFKGFIKEHGYPPAEQAEETIKLLYQQKERELHYSAITIAGKFLKTNSDIIIPIAEHLITTNSWWDSVDGTSSACVRPYFLLHPQLLDKQTKAWVESDNMWLQRSAIICQLGYRDKTNEKVLFRNIKALKDTNEFFLNKAIGWALREYSKTHRERVIWFIANNKLSPLSVREGSKYL